MSLCTIKSKQLKNKSNNNISLHTPHHANKNPPYVDVTKIQLDARSEINRILMAHLTIEELTLLHEYNLKVFKTMNNNERKFNDLAEAQDLLNKSNNLLIGCFVKLSLDESTKVENLMSEQFKLFKFNEKYKQINNHKNYL